jgi:hypothetical protein
VDESGWVGLEVVVMTKIEAVVGGGVQRGLPPWWRLS